MENLFFYDMENLTRVLITIPILYILVVLYVKMAGIRTTAQMNSFDWIVTVALGSVLASTIVLKNVPLIAGAVAVLALILLQFILTKLTFWSQSWKKIVHSTPQLLLLNGKFIEENLRSTRVVKSEILAAIRERGHPNINNVYAVVLETDAKLSVIGMDKSNTSFSLADVQGLPDGLKNDLKNAKQSGDFPEFP
jgi:uncharacterized membrane protein YcaP (DUF421 family)